MDSAVKKQYLPLSGKPLFLRTIESLVSWSKFSGIILVVPPDDLLEVGRLLVENHFGDYVKAVAGGGVRRESVANGIKALTEARDDDAIFIHDGVRPFPPVHAFNLLEESCRPNGALLAIPCNDTLKRECEGFSVQTMDRQGVWRAQTPQVFTLAHIGSLLEWAEQQNINATDEASLSEARGLPPKLIMGDSRNIKITFSDDLALAEQLYEHDRRSGLSMRIGHGYDVHRFCLNRKLILGGVDIPWESGLLGHSDADVLAHAVADACLGAAGLGDIGRHFPDSDPAWAGASSLGLLSVIADMLKSKGLSLVSADATVVAQKPKIAYAIPAMEANLCRSLKVDLGVVRVKATTTEGLGFEGRMEGISSHAVALVG